MKPKNAITGGRYISVVVRSFYNVISVNDVANKWPAVALHECQVLRHCHKQDLTQSWRCHQVAE